MNSLRKILKEDLHRHAGLQGFKGFIRGWSKPGFRYTFFFRLTCYLSKPSPLNFIARLFKRYYRIKYGFEIDNDAQIGEGFYLSDHIGTIVIGPVKIGKYCNVSHLVTIGRAYRNGKIGRPTIGDRVWIGTGAVLVGAITIGSDVMIAPNSFVNVDVPDHSIVIGNPARIISKPNPTKHYINYILPS
jgi:serine O-acetyltransferase